MKVIAIATNRGPKLKSATTGLWLSELTHYTHAMAEAGHRVDIASPKGGRIPVDESSVSARALEDPANAAFMADSRMKAALESSLGAGDVNPADYDILYLAGGHGTMWDFRDSPELQKLITAMYSAGKYISGVCHGVCGFIDAVDAEGQPIVVGKRVTGFSNLEDQLAGALEYMPYLLEDELVKKGADYQKNLTPFTSRVEVAGKLITGQNPQSAKDLALQQLKLL